MENTIIITARVIKDNRGVSNNRGRAPPAGAGAVPCHARRVPLGIARSRDQPGSRRNEFPGAERSCFVCKVQEVARHLFLPRSAAAGTSLAKQHPRFEVSRDKATCEKLETGKVINGYGKC